MRSSARARTDLPLDEVERQLWMLLHAGVISVRPVEPPRIRVEVEEGEVLGPEPPRADETAPTFFEVTFVDHTGEAISGLELVLSLPGTSKEAKTDGSGTARFDGINGNFATVRVKDFEALAEILEPRFAESRKASVPEGPEQTRVMFVDEVPGIALTSEVLHTVILGPELAKLSLELFDKTGRVRHAKRKYELRGPEQFSGETDEQGRLLHEGVTPGDYALSLELRFFDGADEVVDTYESVAVAIPSPAAPQVRLLGAVPRVVMARIRGMLFERNKALMLPGAIGALREIRNLYEENNPGKLLVVGHTDTTGEPAINDPLSKQRADLVAAYLKDEKQPWLDMYGTGQSESQRWGKREDLLMIGAMPDFKSRPAGESPIRWYQATRQLQVDGVAGTETRNRLVTEYMSLDGGTLQDSEDSEFDIEISTHGCGENFPVDLSGDSVDAAPPDGTPDRMDRRAELFFFDAEFGIVPAPTSASGAEYEKWRDAAQIVDFFVEPPSDLTSHLQVIEVEDGMFNLDSAVVLPEAERPSEDAHESLTSIGVFATALVHVQSNPRRKLLLAGHTDTSGTEAHNQELSEQRAEAALCCLEGPSRREDFAALCDQRHKVRDYKQILSWVDRAFGFGCDPGTIDDVAATGKPALDAFKAAYNQKRAELGVSGAAELSVDGNMGPDVWGAFFDCYEAALGKELSRGGTADERAAEVSKLRENLVFVDDGTKSQGFGEHYPIDQVGRDGIRSQENRRVELLFFLEGGEPDLTFPPESSEIYVPGVYQREVIPVPESAIAALEGLSKIEHQLRSNSGSVAIANLDYSLDVAGRVLTGKTDAQGLIKHERLPSGDFELVIKGKKTLLGTLPPDSDPIVHVFHGFMLEDGLEIS